MQKTDRPSYTSLKESGADRSCPGVHISLTYICSSSGQLVFSLQRIHGTVGQELLDLILAVSREIRSLGGRDTILLRRKLLLDVIAVIGVIDRKDGLIYTEGIDFTSGKCSGDGWIIIVLLEA